MNHWNEYTDISVQLYRDGPTSVHQVNKFTDIGNNIRAITINSSNGLVNSGKPHIESDVPLAPGKYRIYWKPTNYNHDVLYTWDCSDTDLKSDAGNTKSGNVGEYYYLDFTPTTPSFSFYAILKNAETWNNQSTNIQLSYTNFTDRRCLITLPSLNAPLITNGKPQNLKAVND